MSRAALTSQERCSIPSCQKAIDTGMATKGYHANGRHELVNGGFA
jgi:hypothetical protein